MTCRCSRATHAQSLILFWELPFARDSGKLRSPMRNKFRRAKPKSQNKPSTRGFPFPNIGVSRIGSEDPSMKNLKMRIALGAVMTLAPMVTASAATAPRWHRGIEARQRHQNARIEQGERTGALSYRESERLER